MTYPPFLFTFFGNMNNYPFLECHFVKIHGIKCQFLFWHLFPLHMLFSASEIAISLKIGLKYFF